MSTCSTSTRPSARATAVSTLSASRLRRSGRITSRSITTAMSCLYFLSRTMSSSSRRSSPSTFTRVKPCGAQLLEELAVLALAAAHDRREHHELGALGEHHHLVDDLLGRLRLDRAAAVVAVRVADPGPEQAQVVVDLGDRADCRARVAAGGLLVDRDRRREPLDRVHVGLVHLAQELARVGRQRLDVAALALGVDRVEREARLARAGQPGDHDEGVARQPQVQVLEVVLPGARDDDFATLDQAITSVEPPADRTCVRDRKLRVSVSVPYRPARA